MTSGMGWRARIGLIYPDNGDADDDYYAMAPPNVSVFIARHRAPPLEDLGTHLAAYTDEIRILLEEAARRLVPLHCDSVGHACVTDSFIGGPGHDEEMGHVIERVTGCPATTGTTGFRKALRILGVTRLAVVTPYEETRNDLFLKVLAADGFHVVSFYPFRVPNEVRAFYQSVGLYGESTIRGPELAYRVGKKADCADAEAVLIASTNFRTGPMIDALESDLGKPVLTANQVVMWHALRLAGVRAPQTGLGKLFRVGVDA
jgi:maleate isomerase